MLVRIYELLQNDNELVEAITFATNSQNPVDLRDLKANEPRQEALSTSISGLGYARTEPSAKTEPYHPMNLRVP